MKRRLFAGSLLEGVHFHDCGFGIIGWLESLFEGFDEGLPVASEGERILLNPFLVPGADREFGINDFLQETRGPCVGVAVEV